MTSPKNLNLPSTRTHPLNHPIHLLRLPTRLSHFRHDHVCVESFVHPGGEFEVAGGVDDSFDADEHVFFGVVQPVARTACSDDSLKLVEERSVLDGKAMTLGRRGRKAYLVSLDPDDFVDPCVAPYAKTLSTDFHRSARYPKEEKAFVLKHRDGHRTHLIVRHRPIGQLRCVHYKESTEEGLKDVRSCECPMAGPP